MVTYRIETHYGFEISAPIFNLYGSVSKLQSGFNGPKEAGRWGFQTTSNAPWNILTI
jgi:hypothetical protein